MHASVDYKITLFFYVRSLSGYFFVPQLNIRNISRIEKFFNELVD